MSETENIIHISKEVNNTDETRTTYIYIYIYIV